MMSKKYLLFPDVAGQKSVRKVDLWDQNFDELAVKLEHCIKLNETFQELYHAVKEKLATQPKGKQFDFNESRIFSKLDQFCKRVQKLKDLFTTIPQFSKIASHNLEGLEPMIKTFFVMAEDLKKKNYDLLDFTNNKFDRDFLEFNVNVGELDPSIANFINASFDNIHNTERALALLHKFDSAIQRESLKGDLSSKYTNIFNNFGQDLIVIQHLYEKNKQSPPAMRNMTPIAGKVMWARQLLRRIEDPMKLFQNIRSIMTSKDSKKIVKLYNKVGRALIEFETLWVRAWCDSIDGAKSGLLASLVVKHPRTGKLFVNFDHEILKLIRESKCIQRMQGDIPENAKMVLLQEDKFKFYYAELKFVLAEYDRVMSHVIPVIQPLMRAHYQHLDNKIVLGIEFLTWQSLNIEQYVTRMQNGILKFEELLNKIAEIVDVRVEKNLRAISKMTLVDISAEETFTLDQFVNMQEKVTKRQIQMMDTKNLEVERACNDLIDLVQNYPLEDTPQDGYFEQHAQHFKDHYQKLMYLAILNATKHSFFALKKRLSNRAAGTFMGLSENQPRPFFDLNVELSLPNVSINPGLEEIQAAINRCGLNVLRCSKRICQWGQDRTGSLNSLATFHSKIAGDLEIVKMVLLLTASVELTKRQVAEYLDSFMSYDHLWKSDKQAAYLMFLKTKPSLEAFHEEITKYDKIDGEIADLPSKKTIGCMWLDATPVKESLRVEARSWKSQYAKNLHHQARDEMHQFCDFMKEVSSYPIFIRILFELVFTISFAEVIFFPSRCVSSWKGPSQISTMCVRLWQSSRAFEKEKQRLKKR